MSKTTLRTVREQLAGAIRAAVTEAHVYDHVTAAPIGPAVVVVPDEPYLEPLSIGRDPVRARARFRVTLLVGMADNAGSLDRIEQLAVAVFAALPEGYVVGQLTRPGITTVGTTDMLVADVAVQHAVAIDKPAGLEPEPDPDLDPED